MEKIPLEMESEETQIRFRDCFSVRYIQSAAVLCRLAYAIERDSKNAGPLPTAQALSHEAFCLNALLSSVAFLESTINELYADAVDEAYPAADAETAELLRTIAAGWQNGKNFDRAPLVTKYRKVLEIAGREPFGEDDPAFAHVRTVIGIRNFLLHYRREWVVIDSTGPDKRDDSTEGAKFAALLKNRFAPNPLADRNLPFFPYQCLGHGCTEWAIMNCLIFTDEFFRRLALPAPYEGIRDELGTR